MDNLLKSMKGFEQYQELNFNGTRSKVLYKDQGKYLNFQLKHHCPTCVAQNIFHYSSPNQLTQFCVNRMGTFDAYKLLLYNFCGMHFQSHLRIDQYEFFSVLFAATSFVDVILLIILILLFLLIQS